MLNVLSAVRLLERRPVRFKAGGRTAYTGGKSAYLGTGVAKRAAKIAVAVYQHVECLIIGRKIVTKTDKLIIQSGGTIFSSISEEIVFVSVNMVLTTISMNLVLIVCWREPTAVSVILVAMAFFFSLS